ncbi:MAG: hypothetical protein KF765_05570 [Parvibaculaceae bacterium]|nr:hypothetical protein [Parvibaculaceae bacterium]
MSDLEEGMARDRPAAIARKGRSSYFVARLGGRLRLSGRGLAIADGLTRVAGRLGRFMRSMMNVVGMFLMRGGGLARCSGARTGQGARKQDACKIEKWEL